MSAISMAVAQDTKPAFSLANARLNAVRDISQEPDAPRICSDDGRVCFDGSFLLSFDIGRTLAGPPVRGKVFFKQASAMPRIGGRYLIVVSMKPGGASSVEWRGPLRDGLCAEPAALAEWGLETALKKYPCLK